MSEPDAADLVGPEHADPEGPVRGWAAADFGPEDYVGDAETDALPLVADGTQTDGTQTDGTQTEGAADAEQ